ncbi:12559_t:CDS:1, partial [Racocetra persica]
ISRLRSGRLFRTHYGRIPANQEEVLETSLPRLYDNLPTYQEAVHSDI